MCLATLVLGRLWAQTSHSAAAVGALSLSGDVMTGPPCSTTSEASRRTRLPRRSQSGPEPTVAVRRIWESVLASAMATSPPVETPVEHRRRLLGRSSLKNVRGAVY